MKEYYWKEWPPEAAAPNTHKRVFELLLKHSRELNQIDILDVPCGAGAFSNRLSETGANVTAVDISQVESFQFDTNKLVIQDINDGLPFKDQTFDVIISIEGIEHLENPSYFLRECARVMKKNGYLILTTPNVDSFRSRRKYFLHGFPRFFSPMGEALKQDGHIHPIDMIFINGAIKKAGLQMIEITVNKISDKIITRVIKNIIKKTFVKKLPENMRGEIPFFGDVIIYVMKLKDN